MGEVSSASLLPPLYINCHLSFLTLIRKHRKGRKGRELLAFREKIQSGGHGIIFKMYGVSIL